MSAKKSRNDEAWEIIFEEEKILQSIESEGTFEIAAATINKYREARLMTKFDHEVQLPNIFRRHNLSIQPISRGRYIIGPFNSYFKFSEQKIKPEINYKIFSQNIESINPQQISSESEAILCAYLTGMIDEILGEETSFTVFGRMSTGSFDYQIENQGSTAVTKVSVEKAQCEIDAGFEGDTKFGIIEAKCHSVDDFISRQLYYPYRLWSSKIEKEVIPIFISFSNNIFSFSVFRFSNLHFYNSMELVSEHRFCIGSYEIDLSEIQNILFQEHISIDKHNKIFPQADKFTRVIDLLSQLYFSNTPVNKSYITEKYAFDTRQTDYYVSAASYLDLINKQKINGQTYYSPSPFGISVMESDPKTRNLKLVSSILSNKVFNLTLRKYLDDERKPNRKEIIDIMRKDLQLKESTLDRRAQTVEKWVDWILELSTQ